MPAVISASPRACGPGGACPWARAGRCWWGRGRIAGGAASQEGRAGNQSAVNLRYWWWARRIVIAAGLENLAPV